MTEALQLFSAGIGAGVLFVWSIYVANKAYSDRCAWKSYHTMAQESRFDSVRNRLNMHQAEVMQLGSGGNLNWWSNILGLKG